MSDEQSKGHLDILNTVLAGVQEQIRFADSKAAFVVVFHTFLFGLILSQAEHLGPLWSDPNWATFVLRLALLVAYLGASVTSMVYAILVVIPQFGEKAPNCKIFFGHIEKCYGRDYERYAKDVAEMKEHDWTRDVATQIVENSNIASDKHRRASVAAKWSIVVVILAAALVASTVVVSAQSSIASTQPNKSE